MLITIATYRAVTGDQATDAPLVSARIEEATDLLAEALDRIIDGEEALSQDDYTETLTPTRDGWLWPRATPLLSATGWEIDGDGLRPSGPFAVPSIIEPSTTITVTYTGGWVERSSNPTAPNRLPRCIQRDLAWAAHALTSPDAADISSRIPVGARSVNLGDAAVTFADRYEGAEPPEITWSRRTLAYRYRVVRGSVPCYP